LDDNSLRRVTVVVEVRGPVGLVEVVVDLEVPDETDLVVVADEM
jgi:hypothetical protein